MNKADADSLIIKYQPKVFGFAMSKVRNISDAEELASNIVFELYKSFLKSESIVNIDGYVYRISSNVYAKFVDNEVRNKHTDILQVACPVNESGYENLEDEDVYNNLRKQIGRLSNRQRTITYMKYYKDMSVTDIANQLGISVGTVKWHLSDIRNGLKEEINMVKSNNLSVNPIYFNDMGHSGTPGKTGDTMDMFDSRLKQNIAWSCYYESKTMTDIAKDLEVPVAYIEGELKKLVEWGYIDQVDNSKNPKYLTNMFITDDREDFSDNIEIKKNAAKFLVDNLYKDLFEKFDKAEDNWGMICPDNDKNYLKYNLVMMTPSSIGSDWQNWEDFAVKRPDGGYFIAYATVTDDCTKKINDYKYAGCGYMLDQVWKDAKCVLQSKQYNCMYSDREIGWRNNRHEDWQDLYSFLSNGCSKDKISVESFSNLSEKGYVADDETQITVIKTNRDNFGEAIDSFVSEHFAIPDKVIKESKKVDERLYAANKMKYPKHLEGLVKYNNSNSFTWAEMIPFVIEILLEEGILKPLTAKQKKAVFSVVMIRE